MNKKTYFQRVTEQTPTRFWINNATEEEARLAIDSGAVGCTQNPAYVWKMLNSSEKSNVIKMLDRIIKSEKDDNEVLVILQRELVEKISKIFLPLYISSNGKQGFVSIQGDPFREDIGSMLKYARFNREAGDNIMAKLPVVKEGLEAIEILIGEKVPINATEVMAVKQALDVCEIYKKATKEMKDPAPLYFSHITGIYDEYLIKIVKENKIDISSDALWQAGISIAKKIYWMVKEKNYEVGFIGGGARGLHHFTEMVGADCCVTINWKGTADALIEQDPPVVQRFFQPTPDSVIDELIEKIEDYRRGYFVNNISPDEYEDFGPVVHFRNIFEEAWKNMLKYIRDRRTELGL
jgi:transaldolase